MTKNAIKSDPLNKETTLFSMYVQVKQKMSHNFLSSEKLFNLVRRTHTFDIKNLLKGGDS